MFGSNLDADIKKIVGRDAKFRYFRLWLNGSRREMTAQALRRILYLGQTNTELNGSVAILLDCTLSHNLTILHPEYCHRHMLTCVVIDASHAQLLCNYT